MGSGKKILENRGFKNVVCIGNVVYASHENHEIQREKVIIHVGRLDRKVKRQHLALEAFSRIANDYPEWKLKLVGGDSVPTNYLDEMREYVIGHKLNSRVIFAGKCENVYPELISASIFVFPSLYEGFGMSLCEAMSAGLPVIGFENTPGVSELIQDGVNGILCNNSVESLADAYRLLILDEKLREDMGRNGKYFVAQFNVENIFNKWDRIINY